MHNILPNSIRITIKLNYSCKFNIPLSNADINLVVMPIVQPVKPARVCICMQNVGALRVCLLNTASL